MNKIAFMAVGAMAIAQGCKPEDLYLVWGRLRGVELPNNIDEAYLQVKNAMPDYEKQTM